MHCGMKVTKQDISNCRTWVVGMYFGKLLPELFSWPQTFQEDLKSDPATVEQQLWEW